MLMEIVGERAGHEYSVENYYDCAPEAERAQLHKDRSGRLLSESSQLADGSVALPAYRTDQRGCVDTVSEKVMLQLYADTTGGGDSGGPVLSSIPEKQQNASD